MSYFHDILQNFSNLNYSDQINIYSIISSFFLGIVAIVISVISFSIPYLKEKEKSRKEKESRKQKLDIKTLSFDYNILNGYIYLYVTFINQSNSPITIYDSFLRANVSTVEDIPNHFARVNFIKEPVQPARFVNSEFLDLDNGIVNSNKVLPIDLKPTSSMGCFLAYSYNKNHIPDTREVAYWDNYLVTFITNGYDQTYNLRILKEFENERIRDMSVVQSNAEKFSKFQLPK